jgi:competence protein ComEC
MLTGSLLPPLAVVAGGVCGVSLDVLSWAVETGYQLSGHTTWTTGPADWWLVGFYGALAILAVTVGRWHIPRRWIAAGISLWILVGVAPPLARALWPPARLEVCSLSVGRGLAVVLHLPDGTTLLYDAGHLGPPASATGTVADYLWDRGITHIDAVVISHPDVDHFNGIAGLVDRFSIGAVYVSPMFEENDSGSVRALAQRLADAGVAMDVISAGDRLGSGDYRIDVLFPTVLGVLGDDNANSLVLAVEYKGRRILLTGDLESPGLDAVLAEAPYDCDVLQVPHHGSAGSMPAALARWCTPEVAIVSGGFGQSPTSVSRVYTAAGADVLNTAYDGAILVTIDRDELRVEPFIARQ